MYLCYVNTLSKTKAKEIKSLATKKERDRQGLFIAEGDKCVRDLLQGFEPQYLISTQDGLKSLNDITDKYSDRILISDKRGMEIISSFSSLPEIIGVFHQPGETKPASLQPDHLYLLLDEIQDPGNLGTIIRTCDWFGVYDIFASKNTVDVFSPKVIQATMGSLVRVKVRYTDLNELIKENKEIPVIGTLLDGKPLETVSLPSGGFLLMGNEGRGISEPLKELITLPVSIPPKNRLHHPDSLNVAIATALMLQTLTS